MKVKAHFRVDLRKARVNSDIQVNRSADAGNKISIYCAAEVAGGRGEWKLRIEREKMFCLYSSRKWDLRDTLN